MSGPQTPAEVDKWLLSFEQALGKFLSSPDKDDTDIRTWSISKRYNTIIFLNTHLRNSLNFTVVCHWGAYLHLAEV